MKYDVYQIVNGCSLPCCFTGTLDECKMFTHDWRERGFDWILLKSDDCD